jgi:hypothetical protein
MSKDKIEKLASALDLAGYEITQLTEESKANSDFGGVVVLRLLSPSLQAPRG